MASIGKRIEALEGLIQPPASPKDEAAALRRALIHDILDEFASLKASGAVGYRGGKRIEPEDIPGKVLGLESSGAGWKCVTDNGRRASAEGNSPCRKSGYTKFAG